MDPKLAPKNGPNASGDSATSCDEILKSYLSIDSVVAHPPALLLDWLQKNDLDALQRLTKEVISKPPHVDVFVKHFLDLVGQEAAPLLVHRPAVPDVAPEQPPVSSSSNAIPSINPTIITPAAASTVEPAFEAHFPALPHTAGSKKRITPTAITGGDNRDPFPRLPSAPAQTPQGLSASSAPFTPPSAKGRNPWGAPKPSLPAASSSKPTPAATPPMPSLSPIAHKSDVIKLNSVSNAVIPVISLPDSQQQALPQPPQLPSSSETSVLEQLLSVKSSRTDLIRAAKLMAVLLQNLPPPTQLVRELLLVLRLLGASVDAKAAESPRTGHLLRGGADCVIFAAECLSECADLMSALGEKGTRLLSANPVLSRLYPKLSVAILDQLSSQKRPRVMRLPSLLASPGDELKRSNEVVAAGSLNAKRHHANPRSKEAMEEARNRDKCLDIFLNMIRECLRNPFDVMFHIFSGTRDLWNILLPANYPWFAETFQAQLLQDCAATSAERTTTAKPTEGPILMRTNIALTNFDRAKVEKLNRRLPRGPEIPASVNFLADKNPFLEAFRENEAIFLRFLAISNNHMFSQILLQTIRGRMLELLRDSPSLAASTLSDRVSQLRLLAKFACFLMRNPTASSVGPGKLNLELAGIQELVRSQELFDQSRNLLDIVGAIYFAEKTDQLVLYIPWITDFLRVERLDKLFRETKAFQASISAVIRIYRSIRQLKVTMLSQFFLISVLERFFEDMGLDPSDKIQEAQDKSTARWEAILDTPLYKAQLDVSPNSLDEAFLHTQFPTLLYITSLLQQANSMTILPPLQSAAPVTPPAKTPVLRLENSSGIVQPIPRTPSPIKPVLQASDSRSPQSPAHLRAENLRELAASPSPPPAPLPAKEPQGAQILNDQVADAAKASPEGLRHWFFRQHRNLGLISDFVLQLVVQNVATDMTKFVRQTFKVNVSQRQQAGIPFDAQEILSNVVAQTRDRAQRMSLKYIPQAITLLAPSSTEAEVLQQVIRLAVQHAHDFLYGEMAGLVQDVLQEDFNEMERLRLRAEAQAAKAADESKPARQPIIVHFNSTVCKSITDSLRQIEKEFVPDFVEKLLKPDQEACSDFLSADDGVVFRFLDQFLGRLMQTCKFLLLMENPFRLSMAENSFSEEEKREVVVLVSALADLAMWALIVAQSTISKANIVRAVQSAYKFFLAQAGRSAPGPSTAPPPAAPNAPSLVSSLHLSASSTIMAPASDVASASTVPQALAAVPQHHGAPTSPAVPASPSKKSRGLTEKSNNVIAVFSLVCNELSSVAQIHPILIQKLTDWGNMLPGTSCLLAIFQLPEQSPQSVPPPVASNLSARFDAAASEPSQSQPQLQVPAAANRPQLAEAFSLRKNWLKHFLALSVYWVSENAVRVSTLESQVVRWIAFTKSRPQFRPALWGVTLELIEGYHSELSRKVLEPTEYYSMLDFTSAVNMIVKYLKAEDALSRDAHWIEAIKHTFARQFQFGLLTDRMLQ